MCSRWARGWTATAISPSRAWMRPGYTTVNLATTYDLTQHLALFGRIDNLFDRHFENPIGFLQPGIGGLRSPGQVLVTIRYRSLRK